MDKAWNTVIDPCGEKHKLYRTQQFGFFSEPDTILSLLTNPRWAWFDSARNEDYYKDAVEWLKKLAEKSAD